MVLCKFCQMLLNYGEHNGQRILSKHSIELMTRDHLNSDDEMPLTRTGKFAVNAEYETSLQGVWAGGDCINSGEDLTVQAVEDGKQAAIAIHRKLTGKNNR